LAYRTVCLLIAVMACGQPLRAQPAATFLGFWPGMDEAEITRVLELPNDWRHRWCRGAGIRSAPDADICAIHGFFSVMEGHHREAAWHFTFESRAERRASAITLYIPFRSEAALAGGIEDAIRILNRMTGAREAEHLFTQPCHENRTFLGQEYQANVFTICNVSTNDLPSLRVSMSRRVGPRPIKERTASLAEIHATNRPLAQEGASVRIGTCRPDYLLVLADRPGTSTGERFFGANQCGRFAAQARVLRVEGDWVRVRLQGQQQQEGWVEIRYLNPQNHRVPPPHTERARDDAPRDRAEGSSTEEEIAASAMGPA
jgi:hypothetical protein